MEDLGLYKELNDKWKICEQVEREAKVHFALRSVSRYVRFRLPVELL